MKEKNFFSLTASKHQIKEVVSKKYLSRYKDYYKMLDGYKKKYEWMCIINTPYYNKTEILEEIKYYSYMITNLRSKKFLNLLNISLFFDELLLNTKW